MDALTLRAGLLIALAAALAQALLHSFNMLILDGRVWHLNADVDGNSLAWLGSMTIFAAAVGALLLASVTPRRASLLVLAAAFAALSLDEFIAVHERLGQEAREALGAAVAFGRVVWPVLFLPLLAAVLVAAVRSLALLEAPSRRRLIEGLGLLALAVALEAAWAAFFYAGGEEGTWPDVLEVSAEEGAELAGWIFISSALLAEFVRRAPASADR